MICQGRLVSSFILLFLMTACGSAHNGWSAFPVAIYADSSISNSTTSESDFRDAMAFWENKAGKKLFDYKGVWNSNALPYKGNPASPEAVTNNVIFFQNPWPFAQAIVGQTMVTSSQTEIQAAMVMINPVTNFCAGDCINESFRTSERKVIAHELGHFLGLQHNQNTANLMYPESLPGGSLADVTIDEATFQALTSDR